MKGLLVFITVVLVAAACGAGDPAATPADTTTTTAPTSTVAPATTTTSPPASTSAAPADWVLLDEDGPAAAVWNATGYDDATLTTPGTGDAAVIAYQGTAEAPFALDIDWGDPAGRTVLSGTTRPTDTGLWIDIDTVDDETGTLGAAPIAAEVEGSGSVRIWGPPAAEWDNAAVSGIQILLRAVLVPFPTEPIAPGATWSTPGTGPHAFLRAPTYELVDREGPLVTLQLSGDASGFSLSDPWLSRGSSAPRSGTHDGTITIDTSSGRVIGQIAVTGEIGDEGGETFTETLDIESPTVPMLVLGAAVDTEFRIGVDFGDLVGEDRITLSGSAMSEPKNRSGVPGFSGRAEMEGDLYADEFVDPVDFDETNQTEWSRSDFFQALEAFIDGMLPDWVDDRSLRGPLPFGGIDQLKILEVGIGGTTVPITWRISELDGADVVITIDAPFAEDTSHRGALVRTVGTVTGTFVVNRFNVLDVRGRLDVVFDYTFSSADQPSIPVHQWWEAVALDAPDN
ncbi:MAG: hypothetical protein R2707_21070 [Acidimicrobiales bacterium]